MLHIHGGTYSTKETRYKLMYHIVHSHACLVLDLLSGQGISEEPNHELLHVLIPVLVFQITSTPRGERRMSIGISVLWKSELSRRLGSCS